MKWALGAPGIACLVVGVGLGIYAGIEYFDFKKKTTTNELLLGVAGVLTILGVVLIIIGVRSEKKPVVVPQISDGGIELTTMGSRMGAPNMASLAPPGYNDSMMNQNMMYNNPMGYQTPQTPVYTGGGYNPMQNMQSY